MDWEASWNLLKGGGLDLRGLEGWDFIISLNIIIESLTLQTVCFFTIFL